MNRNAGGFFPYTADIFLSGWIGNERQDTGAAALHKKRYLDLKISSKIMLLYLSSQVQKSLAVGAVKG